MKLHKILSLTVVLMLVLGAASADVLMPSAPVFGSCEMGSGITIEWQTTSGNAAGCKLEIEQVLPEDMTTLSALVEEEKAVAVYPDMEMNGASNSFTIDSAAVSQWEGSFLRIKVTGYAADGSVSDAPCGTVIYICGAENAVPSVIGVETESVEVVAGIEAAFKVVTDANAAFISLNAEKGQSVKTWPAEGNSLIEDGVRVWSIQYTFKSAGSRRLSVSASADGTTYGEAAPLNLEVKSEPSKQIAEIYSAAFDAQTAAVGSDIGITVTTSDAVKFVTMSAENGKQVKTWTAEEASSSDGKLRTWKMSYAFSGAGQRKLSFAASLDDKEYSEAIPASVTVGEIKAEPQLISVEFDSQYAVVQKACFISAVTDADSTVLSMCAENGSIVSTWKAEENSTVADGKRIWKLSYKFGKDGERTLPFKTSIDGENYSEPMTASVKVLKDELALAFIGFDADKAKVGTPVAIVASTTSQAESITMYSEKGSAVKTWQAADSAEDVGGIREWKITYTFTGAGNRKLTFDAADKDGNKTKAVECPITVDK